MYLSELPMTHTSMHVLDCLAFYLIGMPCLFNLFPIVVYSSGGREKEMSKNEVLGARSKLGYSEGLLCANHFYCLPNCSV